MRIADCYGKDGKKLGRLEKAQKLDGLPELLAQVNAKNMKNARQTDKRARYTAKPALITVRERP